MGQRVLHPYSDESSVVAQVKVILTVPMVGFLTHQECAALRLH